MADFHQRVQAMLTAEDPSQAQIMVATMGIDPVKSLGEDNPASDAKSLMLQAAEAGVQVHFPGQRARRAGSEVQKIRPVTHRAR